MKKVAHPNEIQNTFVRIYFVKTHGYVISVLSVCVMNY